jgi:hypothetical protein
LELNTPGLSFTVSQLPVQGRKKEKLRERKKIGRGAKGGGGE